MYANVDKCVKHICACKWPRISGKTVPPKRKKCNILPRKLQLVRLTGFPFPFLRFCVDTKDTMRNGFDGNFKEYQLFLGFADKCRENK